MRDETKGIKTNRVILNIGQHPGVEPPEPGIAAVMIDGNPIHAITYIQITAGVDQLTRCNIVFECEVGGEIRGRAVEEIIQEMKDRHE